MKKKYLQPLKPAALYARVFSDPQDVDLSVAAQLRELRNYADRDDYPAVGLGGAGTRRFAWDG